VGYLTIGEHGSILQANLTAAKLLGVARGDLVKQPFSRFILREDQDVYYLRRKALLDTGVPQAWESAGTEKGCRAVLVRLETTAARDAAGAPVCRAW